MTTQFRWVEADLVSAQWTWMKYHPAKFAAGFWYPIAVLVLAVIMFAQHPDKWLNFLLLLSMVGALIGISLLIQRWRWHRMFRKTPMWQDHVSADVDAQSIRLRGQTFESTQCWGQFSDVYESRRVFIFGSADNRFTFIPKSGMNPSQTAEVRALISANAKGKVKLATAIA